MRNLIAIFCAIFIIQYSSADVVINSSFTNLATSPATGKTLVSPVGSTTGATPQGIGFYFTTGPEAASYLRAWRLNSMTVGLSTKFFGGSFDSFNGSVSAYLYKVTGNVPTLGSSIEYVSNTGPQNISINASSSVSSNLTNINLTGLGTLVDGQYVIDANTKYLVGLNFAGTFGSANSALYLDQSANASTTSLGWAMGGTYQQTTTGGYFNNTQTNLVGAKNSNSVQYDLDATAVPEAAPIILFGAGLAVMVGISFFRRKKSSGMASVKA